jgi:hypothetical protein
LDVEILFAPILPVSPRPPWRGDLSQKTGEKGEEGGYYELFFGLLKKLCGFFWTLS